MAHSSIVINRKTIPEQFSIVSLEMLPSDHLETTTDSSTFDFGWPSIGGEFTISVWAKALSSASAIRAVYGIGAGTNIENRFWFLHDIGAGTMEMQLYRASAPFGVLRKDYRVSLTIPSIGEWYMFTCTFDGTNDTDAFKLYLQDEYDTSPTKASDFNLTGLTNIDMRGSIGANGNAGGGFAANHRIYSLATWDSVLSAGEISYIYNNKNPSVIDLTTNKGNYNSSGNLKNLYLLGKQLSPNLGHDFGPQAVDMTREFSMNDTNIVDDFPQP